MNTVEVIQSIIVGGAATTLATQILKNPYIPIPADRFPRLTAAVVSLVASGVVVFQAGFELANLSDWTQAVAIFAGVLLVASNTYTQLVKRD